MAKPTLDEIWQQSMGQAPGMPPTMINPQVGSGSFDLNGPVNQSMGMIEQPQFGQIPQIQSAPQEPKKSFGKKVVDFLGQTTGISGLYGASKKAGEISRASDELGLGVHNEVQRLISEAKKFKTGDPKRKALLKQAQEVARQGGVGADALLGSLPKDRQVIGSAGKLALTVGSLGMGAPATVGGRLAAGTLTGGAFGGLDAAERGGDLGDIAKGAGIGAATGLAVGGLMEGLRYAASHWATRQFQKGARFTPTELTDENVQKAIEYGTKQGKVFKSAQSAVDFYEKGNNTLEGEISKQLSSSAGKIKPRMIAEQIARDMNEKGWVTSADDVFEKIVSTNQNAERFLRKTSLSVTDANAVKKLISSNIRDSAWFASQPPPSQDFLMAVRRSFAEAVKNAAPETRKLFEEQMYNIILRDGFQAAVDKGVVGGGLVNSASGAILGGGAGVLGGVTGPGAIMGAAATKFVHTTLGRTLLAKGFSQVIPIIVKLAPAEQELIAQAILNSTNEGQEIQ